MSSSSKSTIQAIKTLYTDEETGCIHVKVKSSEKRPPPTILGLPIAFHPELGEVMEHHISSYPVYSQLPRLATLPPNKCPISATTEDAQEVLTKLWNGNFNVKFEEKKEKESEVFTLEFDLDDEELPASFRKEFRQGQDGLAIIRFFVDKKNNGADYATHSISLEEEFGLILPRKKLCTVLARALHHFIRQYSFFLSWSVVKRVLAFIQCRYKSRSMVEATLDNLMVAIDHMLGVFGDHKAAGAIALMVPVADAMLAMKRLEEGGNLYNEIAQNCQQNSDLVAAYTNYIRAGHIFHQALCLEEALSSILLAFRALLMGGNNVGEIGWWGENNFVQLINKFLTVFIEKTAHGDSPGWSEEKGSLCTMFGLLHATGFFLKEFSAPVNSETAKRFIKPKYKATKRAKQLLINAVKGGTFKNFLEVLDAARNPKVKSTSFLAVLNQCSVEKPLVRDEAELANTMQQHVKSWARKAGGIEFEVRPCVSCENMDHKGEFLSCPCTEAFYCSKECQKDNWAEHKQVCTWHLSKQQN